MNFSRLKKMPFSRLVKKAFGYDEIYAIAIRKGYPGKLMDDRTDPFSIISGKSGHWYADPFLYSFQGKMYLFAEAYSRANFRGYIVATEIFDGMSSAQFTDVIREPYHMSFPMVFSWNDELYMIPETSENKSINIYKSVEFPYKWKLMQQFAVGESYVDTIVLQKSSNEIECLTSMVSDENPLLVKYQKFFIYREDGKINIEWNNTFNRTSSFNLEDRNAGPIIERGKKVYIPTQSSSELDYGIKVKIREVNSMSSQVIVNELTKDDIAIEGIDNGNIIGIHTYSCANGYEVIDVRYTVFSPVYQWRKVLRR